DARDTIQYPGKFRMGGHLGLVEHNMALGVDTGGDIGGGDFTRIRGEFLRVLPDRDRVHIHDAIDAFVSVLKAHEIADRAQIIAEMQIAGGLNARENAVLRLVHCRIPSLWRLMALAQVMRRGEPEGNGKVTDWPVPGRKRGITPACGPAIGSQKVKRSSALAP